MATWPSSEEDLQNAARILYHQSGPQPEPPLIQGADRVTRLPWIDKVSCKIVRDYLAEPPKKLGKFGPFAKKIIQKDERFRCIGQDTFRGDIWITEVDNINLEKKHAWRQHVEENKVIFAAGPWRGGTHPHPDVKEGPFGNVYGEPLERGSQMFTRVKCYIIPDNDKLGLFCRVGHRRYDEDLERKPLTADEWKQLFRRYKS